MKNYFLLLALSFMALALADEEKINDKENNQAALNDLCGGTEASFGVITKGWEERTGKVKNGYGEDVSEYCVTAQCKPIKDFLTFERKKCLSQRYENSITTSYTDSSDKKNYSGARSYNLYTVLTDGDECFDVCKPVPEILAGIEIGKTIGLDRESCLTCFMRRQMEYQDHASFFLKEASKTIFQGMKCYSPCAPKAGRFSIKQEITKECKQCVGFDGYPPQDYQYIQNQAGDCFETDKAKAISVVSPQVCRIQKNVVLTKFIKQTTKAGFWSSSFTGCYEVDEFSQGNIYKRLTDLGHCEHKAIVDTQRSEKSKAALPDQERSKNRESSSTSASPE